MILANSGQAVKMGFVERLQWTGEKGRKQCYNIHPVDSAIAFAGLYEFWDFQGDSCY